MSIYRKFRNERGRYEEIKHGPREFLVKGKMGLGFGIYEVEDKEDGVWGFRF